MGRDVKIHLESRLKKVDFAKLLWCHALLNTGEILPHLDSQPSSGVFLI
jgi:hypothetical protein